MVKFYKSLQTQLTLAFLILVTLVAGLTFYFVMFEAKQALNEQMRDELEITAQVMASQIDGDVLSTITSADDTGNENFMKVYNKIWEMRDGIDNIVYAYTLRIVDDDTTIFLVDSNYMFENGSLDVPAALLYEDAPIDEIRLGYEGPTSTQEPYTDEWGTFMTGYAPVKDSQGDVVGVLGIDFDISTVKAKEDFLSSLVYSVIAMAILLSAGAIFYFSTTFIRKLNILKDTMDKFSNGNTKIKVPELKGDCEIYEMGRSLQSVFDAMEFLSSLVKSPDKSKKISKKRK